ncbi:beta-galactosidase [Jidongwangia harbinensis]|uniref:beta-galactosidase n=1 Tax=Jidongwangia harbinensis TaxID=2878561 RepID=UPI001CD9F3E4|nr:beta-galactosidase [Jidongwangia harbinensis]MCA2211817.1 beta-galactosidase [Jidongwangia harbinensis]
MSRTPFPFGLDRPVVYGEYPYYRALPEHWDANLAALARAGVDVVTCYVPWRFHETGDGYDFAGATDPQRDLLRLLWLIAGHGLRAVLKPGPFVHGEVQLGGLPDRVSPSVDPALPAVLDVAGRPVTSQALALPSTFGAGYAGQVRRWLRAVDEQVLMPNLAPRGPVVAVQLGNEGVYSDANQPCTAHDFSAPAVRAFTEALRRTEPALAEAARTAPRQWPIAVRAAWARHGGAVLREQYRDLADALSPATRAIATVNLPLPDLTASGGAASWLLRTAGLAGLGLDEGYTSWVGNAARSESAFAAHWFGVRARRSSNVEDNWGFTWTDESFARPTTALFHALLALGLGSRSCSVYTACATAHWGPEIDLDPAGLRSEGRDPADYGPPYCPGAPLHENGRTGANLLALHALRDLVRQPSVPHGARFGADLALLVPDVLAGTAAWTEADGPAAAVLQAGIDAAVALMTGHQYRVDVLTEQSAEHHHAADVWLVPLGAQEPDAALLALLRRHRDGGGTVLVLAERARPGWSEIGDVLVPTTVVQKTLPRLLPPPRYAHPDSDPGVVFVHEDADGVPMGLFAFNPADRSVTVRRTVSGRTVAVELAPAGAAYLCAPSAGAAFEVAAATTDVELPPFPPTSAAVALSALTEETSWN